MNEKQVWVFFYGLYMDTKILEENKVYPENLKAAKLKGYKLQISSWGYLVPSDLDTVYGVVAALDFADLNQLYSSSSSILTKQYFPKPMLVETLDGKILNTLCYILAETPEGEVNTEYVERMVKLAEHYKFPDWYAERLARFKVPEVSK